MHAEPLPSSEVLDVAVVEDVWGPSLEALARQYTIVRSPSAWKDVEELDGLVARARALVVRNRTTVSASLLRAGERLELVARAGAGTDNIDLAAADDLGVVVINAAGANAQSVAEHTVALGLALSRDLVGNDRRARNGDWSRRLGRELRGRTWGVLGLGATGAAVVTLADGLGMNVVGYDPAISQAGVQPPRLRFATSPEELVQGADIVSIHVPLTPATRGMVGRELLGKMRPGSLLINTARGGIVDEEALADALINGHLGGAGLDVRAQEPPTPGRLEECDNVIFTPHIAGITYEAQAAVDEMLADDVERVLRGVPALHAVGRWRRPARS